MTIKQYYDIIDEVENWKKILETDDVCHRITSESKVIWSNHYDDFINSVKKDIDKEERKILKNVQDRIDKINDLKK
jgi:vacuolar-type H+-ATPase subunit H